MPTINGVGFGDHSQDKQDDFRRMIRFHLGLVDHIEQQWNDRRYTYIDMNAGPGQYEGITGSPLIFLDECVKIGIPYDATFIELDEINANALRYHIKADVTVTNSDHALALRSYRNQPPLGLGLLYHDPTGVVPAFDLLAEVSRYPSLKKIDFMIYLSATNIKRVRLASQTDDVKCLDTYLEAIDKRVWIVRKPRGKEQWTFVIGSNWGDFPDWKKRQFYSVFSPEGKNILDRLTYTETELSKVNGQQVFDGFFS